MRENVKTSALSPEKLLRASSKDCFVGLVLMKSPESRRCKENIMISVNCGIFFVSRVYYFDVTHTTF